MEIKLLNGDVCVPKILGGGGYVTPITPFIYATGFNIFVNRRKRRDRISVKSQDKLL